MSTRKALICPTCATQQYITSCDTCGRDFDDENYISYVSEWDFSIASKYGQFCDQECLDAKLKIWNNDNL